MKFLIGIIILLFLISCNANGTVQEVQEDQTEEMSPLAGYQLMKQHCYLCHNPEAAEFEGRVGPAMVEIKAVYLAQFPDREAFMAAIQGFVDNPDEATVKLHDALERFGLMPKQVYPDGVVEKIAAFLFDYRIDEPGWFAESYQNRTGNIWKQSGLPFNAETGELSYEQIGLDYALGTKKVLGAKLMGTIQEKGTLAALEFCNHQAYPLTDSMSNEFNAEIKRVSDRPRNANNQANAQELKAIEFYKKAISDGAEMKPQIHDEGGHVRFYYPIETNSMCLQCHGQSVEKNVAEKINILYPSDLATGYAENQIRGIWSIRFAKR